MLSLKQPLFTIKQKSELSYFLTAYCSITQNYLIHSQTLHLQYNTLNFKNAGTYSVKSSFTKYKTGYEVKKKKRNTEKRCLEFRSDTCRVHDYQTGIIQPRATGRLEVTDEWLGQKRQRKTPTGDNYTESAHQHNVTYRYEIVGEKKLISRLSKNHLLHLAVSRSLASGYESN